MIFKKKKKNVFMYQEEIHLHQSIQKKDSSYSTFPNKQQSVQMTCCPNEVMPILS